VNLNQPTMASLSSVPASYYIAQQSFLVSSAQLWVHNYCGKGKDGGKEVAGVSVRLSTLPTCLSLIKIRNLHSLQHKYSCIQWNVNFLNLFFKRLLIMFAGQIKLYGSRSLAWDISVSIVSDYRLDDRGSIPGRAKDFPLASVSRPDSELVLTQRLEENPFIRPRIELRSSSLQSDIILTELQREG
jgi:hypothetical protein